MTLTMLTMIYFVVNARQTKSRVSAISSIQEHHRCSVPSLAWKISCDSAMIVRNHRQITDDRFRVSRHRQAIFTGRPFAFEQCKPGFLGRGYFLGTQLWTWWNG